MSSWNQEDKERDIVISSRVRLARNVKELPFPLLLPENRAKHLVEKMDGCLKNEEMAAHHFIKTEIADLDKINRQVLVEKHLTSPELGANKGASVFVTPQEDISIMVNEEDHIRIQCIKKGFQIQAAFDQANQIDDALEACIGYAFHEKYGYLTSCPSNVGTGMRASVMLHLPTMTLNNQINNMVVTMSKFGLTIRGIYGEHSQALGDLYQISNQNTLGVTEADTVQTLHDVSREIIKKERELRYEILNNNRVYLEDKIYRAYGILKSARTITSEESMKLLSLVRLGSDLDLLDQRIETINHLMTDIQPGILTGLYGTAMDEATRDKVRADHIREQLQEKE
ncbi:MAG TPA: protein arginine kinase [Eubacteriaceae bacterium]|nr:protein arginine kinase [Eubacteriaceae bacterium]